MLEVAIEPLVVPAVKFGSKKYSVGWNSTSRDCVAAYRQLCNPRRCVGRVYDRSKLELACTVQEFSVKGHQL